MGLPGVVFDAEGAAMRLGPKTKKRHANGDIHHVVTLSVTAFGTIGDAERKALFALARRDPDGMSVMAVSVRRAKCCAGRRARR